jgi:hypothetical protein
MTMPNFLIIGAAKGGTTTLHNVLAQHPDVYMCPLKEVGFFWAYGEDVRLQGISAERLRNRLIDDLDRYQKLFDGVTNEKAIGEASVRYLSTANTPEVIRRFIPGAKLIASLRQPADRAFSAFNHNRRDGIEPCSDFGEAIAQDQNGLRDHWMVCRYLHVGFYYQFLKRYFDMFDRNQIHISLFEDLKEEPHELMSNLFRFLDVDETFVPDLSHRHNVTGIIRNPLLRAAWARSSKLRSVIRPILSDRLRHNVFEWVIRDQDKPQFSPELRLELTDYYYEDINRLQDLLDRDLSHWLEPIQQL